MMAVPHTASTTTDEILEPRKKSWDTSLNLYDRGFICPSKNQLVVTMPRKCNYSNSSQLQDIFNKNSYDNQLSTFDCAIKTLTYRFKEHSNYDILLKYDTDVAFTTLRKPEQSLLSQYRNRDMWDWTFNSLYPDDNLTTIKVEPFITKAWYRHNMFVKMLTTDTQLIFRTDSNKVTIRPSKEESDYENALGKDSAWLRKAIERLKSMPFFGLFHRLSESFELFGFHMCIPVNRTMNPLKQDREVSRELEEIVKKHFVLDILLLETAEELFDDLIADMRVKKEQGILCDIGKLIGSRIEENNDLQLGLMCIDKE